MILVYGTLNLFVIKAIEFPEAVCQRRTDKGLQFVQIGFFDSRTQLVIPVLGSVSVPSRSNKTY